MGVESPPGIGASALPDAPAHDRICSRHPTTERASCHLSVLISSRVWVWSTHSRHLLENGALPRSRLSSPARWDAPLSSRAAASPPGAASRSRWQSTRGLCGQHSPLPPLPTARTVSMGGQRHGKAAPGKCAAAPAAGGSCTAALARLEPQNPPTRLHAAGATATHRGQPLASRCFATCHGRDLLPCTARTLASLMGRAARAQYASCNGWPGHDQAVRYPRHLCRRARVGDGLTRTCSCRIKRTVVYRVRPIHRQRSRRPAA